MKYRILFFKKIQKMLAQTKQEPIKPNSPKNSGRHIQGFPSAATLGKINVPNRSPQLKSLRKKPFQSESFISQPSRL